MTPSNPHYNSIISNTDLAAALAADNVEFPKSETLKMTKDRVVPYWNNVIYPNILNGKNVLIVAHGTVLRSLIMHLEGRYYIVCYTGRQKLI